jgi:hypothetical protein
VDRIQGVQVLPRAVFLDEYWQYRAGQHVTFVAKTQSGKTTLAYQLLSRSARRDLMAAVLVMKPRDPTVSLWTRQLGYPRTVTWPPLRRTFGSRPPGWTVWPRLGTDPEEDERTLYRVFRRVLLGLYQKGEGIVFADEGVDVGQLDDPDAPAARRKPLIRTMEAVWKRGSGMGGGLWVATQRAAGLSYHGYSAPEHMFLAYDPDKKTRKRYDEIGGVDTGLVEAVVMRLPPWHFMYLQRSTGTYCVVAP